MSKKEQIQLFENRNVRTLWDEQEEDWYFSIVDVVAILTDQQDSKKASTYWSVLKGRLRKEGADEPLTKCKKLKMLAADGKSHPTDAATAQTLFRIIQSIPSKKAEPFKQWMAKVASQRLNQMQDPELNFQQAIADYKRLGYSDRWINQRIQTIRARKELTDEWNRAGVKFHQRKPQIISHQQTDGTPFLKSLILKMKIISNQSSINGMSAIRPVRMEDRSLLSYQYAYIYEIE